MRNNENKKVIIIHLTMYITINLFHHFRFLMVDIINKIKIQQSTSLYNFNDM